MPTRMRCRNTRVDRLGCQMEPRGRPQADRVRARVSVMAVARALVRAVAAASGLAKGVIPVAAVSDLAVVAVLRKLARTAPANRPSSTRKGRSTPKKRDRTKCKERFC